MIWNVVKDGFTSLTKKTRTVVNTLSIAVFLSSFEIHSVLAQSAGSTCTAAQCNNIATIPVGTASTQTLVCNSNCSASGTWVLAEQVSANGNVGIAQSSPQAQLDINGGVKIGNDIGNSCGTANAGEVSYTASATSSACTGGSNAGICYCSGSGGWILLASTASNSVGCGQSGSFCGAQSQTLTVAAGCQVTFYGWGGGGGSGENLYNSYTSGAGGGGGSAYVTIPAGTSAVTYYMVIGGAGGGALGTGAYGGESLSGYTGGDGYTTTSGAGGGATGIWTGSYGGTTVMLVGGGGGGGLANNGNGQSGGAGGAAPSVDLNSTSQGVTSTTSSRGGGGGGFLGGCSYNSTYCASGTPLSEGWGGSISVPGGAAMAGSGTTPGNSGLRSTYLTGSSCSTIGTTVGNGGAGVTTASFGNPGVDGAIYWATQ